MANYDIEQYIDDFIVYLKPFLNTAITNINNDNGDTLLTTISDDAFFYKKDSPQTKGSSQFYYYEPYTDVGIDEEGDLSGRYFRKAYQLEMGISFYNNNREADRDSNNNRRVMRYQKAFEEALICVNGKLRKYGHLSLVSIKSSNETRDDNLLHISAFNVKFTMGG